MKLIIVESPTKAKTISRFLPRDFTVESSLGHVRDLPSYELGVDVEHDFRPHYVTPRKSQAVIKNLKECAKKASTIILATDKDREGEAIAWHITKALGLKKNKTVERIVFHEITKTAIAQALKHPRALDKDLVDAQQARRILDRLVGYKLSPFLWKKIMRGLSAGRVQSVALRFVVEREKEIRAFRPQIFWTIEADLQKKGCPDQNEKDCLPFRATVEKINQKPIEKPGLMDKNGTDDFLSELKESEFRVLNLEKKKRERSPYPAYITSTLQQDAFGRLGYSAKQTMRLAQQLYETGFITYMRTDSVNVAPEALRQAKAFLEKELGERYALKAPRRFKTRSKLAQEAHEAIRPTNPLLSPEEASRKLKDNNQNRLYEVIWQRFVASQMPNAITEQTSISVEAKGKNHYELRSSGSILIFDGFLKIYPSKMEEAILPSLVKEDLLSLLKIESIERQTKGPGRFNDASLIKELEQAGIGRPSTYAPILSAIEERGYIIRDPQKRLSPTEVGEKVNELLVEHFANIVDVDFTRQMEENLDEIASGTKKWQPVLQEFYEPFAKNLEEKYQTVEKEDLSEPLDRTCPNCPKSLMIRQGRFGRFIACSGFPECKFTEALPPPSLNIKCLLCKGGDIVERRTKRKRIFYGCSQWPDCDFATWQKPTGKLCIECGSLMTEYARGEKCSNKSCSFRSTK